MGIRKLFNPDVRSVDRKMKSRFMVCLLILSACGSKKKDFKPHQRLLTFQSSTVMSQDSIISICESDTSFMKRIENENFENKSDTIRYDEDMIYVSYLSIVNGCAQYSGDIEIKDDSIFLKLKNINGLECTEMRCDRLIFGIRNVENKKYKIYKK